MSTEMRFRTMASLAALSLLALAYPSCGDRGAGGEDSGTDTGTEIDTSFEFGETTPCVNEARPGEVCIPGGTYLMGCVPGDTECEENEKPLVAVTLSPFFIDIEEATIRQVIDWLNAIKDDPGVQQYESGLTLMDGTEEQKIWGMRWDWGNIDSDSYAYPVIRGDGGDYTFNQEAESSCPNQGGINAVAGGFSWLGAKMYCDWRGGRLLPTEAQWEAAARGQTFREFPCGSDLPECWYGVYACCSSALECGMYQSTLCQCCAPLEVESASTCDSPFGLRGMYGNAYEWVLDYVDEDHQECAVGCIDPQPEAPTTATTAHLAKGGSVFNDNQNNLRVSSRTADSIYVNEGSSITGVRCVRPDIPFAPSDAGIDGGGNGVI